MINYRGGGLMVWDGISIGGRIDLHIIRNDNSTTHRKAKEFLEIMKTMQRYPPTDLQLCVGAERMATVHASTRPAISTRDCSQRQRREVPTTLKPTKDV
ncbi:hypothetical protein TNCV_4572761 [Trichonephila clavipes]|nr:hypothetical protein TNCV_4572761 [Trichonephila clavipes]